MIMATRFNPTLVLMSLFVAIFASYVALNLAHSVTEAKGRARALWLACGALAMGVGIWSMHFVGMLAFEMPGMSMSYDIPLMTLSVVVAVGASALALYIISRSIVPFGSILSGGIAMAAAIAGMHYIGMFSMRMAATIEWNPYLVVTSVAIALAASFGALLILTRLRDKPTRNREMALASTVMGMAIAGMHYTGMLAATFVHHEAPTPDASHVLVTSSLEMTVIVAPLLILCIALAGSVGHRFLAARSKKASEILGRSEERFRLLVEAVKDYAIFMLDLNGRIATWNTGAMRINGYTDDEIIGQHVSIFYTEPDLAANTAEEELRTVRETGRFEGEGKRVRKDGSTYWASIVMGPLYDEDGALTGFSKVTRDITQVKDADRRLRLLNEALEERVRTRTLALEQREAQLRTIADAAPVLIAQVDPDERLLFANDAFCRWFRRSNANVIGRRFEELLGSAAYPYNQPFIEQALRGQVAAYERISHSGDTTATLSITFIPEFGEDKRVSSFVLVASDITKHKEIEAELKKAKDAAEVANSAKSAFLANMSHEIRTPLGAVLGFSELLYSGEMHGSERLDCIEVIKRNGALLSGVINDILDLSKVEAGKLTIEPVDVPFTDIMKELDTALSLAAGEQGLEFKVSAEGAVPKVVRTDPLRLRQILLNIVGNAIKFTNRGSVTVRVKLVPGAEDATKLAFIVTDTGEGIQPQHVAQLFTPFTQADASTTRKFGGTGLGLVLSKRLANALGGDVSLWASTPGEGSTFAVTIDPGPSEQTHFQMPAAPAAGASKTKVPRREGELQHLKVLLAEDSPDNQLLIKKILKRAGAVVETANNGREAIERAMSEDFNLILMDLQMPEMDGYEATKTLRAQGFKKPIIALTAHAMKEERQYALQNGFDDHLTKPIDHALLVKTLSEL